MGAHIDIHLCQTIANDGEVLRYEVLKTPGLPSMTLLEGRTTPEIMEKLADLTDRHLLPKVPRWDNYLLFCPPEDIPDPFAHRDGDVVLPHRPSRIRYWLEKYRDAGEPARASDYLSVLEERGLVKTCRDGGTESAVIPVYPRMTRLSEHYNARRATINTHFFLMELEDVATCWDSMGQPFGLFLLEGKTILPPLYRREALTWSRKKGAHVELLGAEDFSLRLDGKIYTHGKNAQFFRRPDYEATPLQKGTDIVISGNTVVALKYGGGTPVPQGGFICHVPEKLSPGNLDVHFQSPQNWEFAIQVGPSLVEEGKIKKDFSTPYYQGTGISYPPTCYPLDWDKDRAARTGIGFKGNRLVMICVEGSKTQVYRHGKDSTGASLGEFASICEEQGMDCLVNLDGGGSTQMSIMGTRSLKMSDRNDQGEDFERPVPLGLGIDMV